MGLKRRPFRPSRWTMHPIPRAPGHPGFGDCFILFCDGEKPPYHFVDMGYPACWWKGRDGIDRDGVRAYFPALDF
jgi:hypothetical protein